VANPYGSYVSAPQPVYPEVAASHLDGASYSGGYPSQQPADGSWYGGPGNGGPANGGAATGYLPTDYPAGDHAPGGYAANGYGGGMAAGADYAAADYQNGPYQNPGHQPAPAGPGGYGQQQGQFAGQYDQRGYGTPDLSYAQDPYPGYPGYGTGSR
jgi:hypothetical protein